MKQLFLKIQTRLSAIQAIKYIDKDWGQLQMDNPPVNWPCVLIDVENVNYTQMGRGYQKADADITITVANINNVRSSAMAPNKSSAYATIDLMETIHQSLQLFAGDGDFQPLQRTNLKKVFNEGGAEIYTMTYKTAFVVEKIETGKRNVEATAHITIDD